MQQIVWQLRYLGDKLMCSGNDTGNFVMQKTLWCDTVSISGAFPPMKFTTNWCRCMVYWDCSTVSSKVGWHPSSWLHIQLYRAKTCEHSTSEGTGFGKPTRHNLRFIHCCGIVHENCTQHCPWRTVIQQNVFMVGTKMCDGSSQKLMFWDALSIL